MVTISPINNFIMYPENHNTKNTNFHWSPHSKTLLTVTKILGNVFRLLQDIKGIESKSNQNINKYPGISGEDILFEATDTHPVPPVFLPEAASKRNVAYIPTCPSFYIFTTFMNTKTIIALFWVRFTQMLFYNMNHSQTCFFIYL